MTSNTTTTSPFNSPDPTTKPSTTKPSTTKPSTTKPSTTNTTTTPRPSKFRFKDPHRKRRHHHTSPTRSTRKPRPPHRQKHTHTHTHSRPSTPPDPTLTSSTAFRESLFDALGDDEGAAYWESVYGQPIHTYAVPEVPKGPNGELEAMDEEEYAAYVRSRMWERTREGMEAERERLRGEKRRKVREEKEREEERRRFDVAMEESLRRGRERKRRRGWGEVWGSIGKKFKEMVFWPVESGKRADLGREEVEAFMRGCAGVMGEGDNKHGDGNGGGLLGLLKTERVRWHPDKIQHRYGSLGLDESVMRSVTEVFQIVDQMWNEERKKREC
ncbi:hypothetical protein ASPCADRAFT_503597 [Aspergillus carbonarius ITEM 5010]|uniref:Uncharacterized protein n=1 Tax=Aspergillus carbonarius (strain ITEM 5010) TaxID=602072 RepID=A0A1R3RYK7_ASPC5|nr:hypothetical protein ASPCADRAFT_503597 [Aspergillus carbonarius ITEM 5010]